MIFQRDQCKKKKLKINLVGEGRVSGTRIVICCLLLIQFTCFHNTVGVCRCAFCCYCSVMGIACGIDLADLWTINMDECRTETWKRLSMTIQLFEQPYSFHEPSTGIHPSLLLELNQRLQFPTFMQSIMLN